VLRSRDVPHESEVVHRRQCVGMLRSQDPLVLLHHLLLQKVVRGKGGRRGDYFHAVLESIRGRSARLSIVAKWFDGVNSG